MPNSAVIQVLSVVGDADLRRYFREFLAGLRGVTLTGEADNEVEALQELGNKPVDVVLLDLSSRNLDGIRLTKMIRHRHPTVRVLISTAFRRSDDIFAALDAGADGYVLKGNLKGLEIAISSVRLGAVYLDPEIANQVQDVIVNQSSLGKSARTLPTGRLPLPLLPAEKDLLSKVASSNCKDGVCMVDPEFVKKLRRFGPD